MSRNSDIQIDESSHKASLSVPQRLKNALIAVVMGIVLVQVFYFWRAFKTGSFGFGNSVVMLMDNYLFIAFLVVCAVMGWLTRQQFINKLIEWIGDWKFW